ncbi:hypothetical protein ABIA32_001574 [Streptacidiphilus sp. MAP12-20]
MTALQPADGGATEEEAPQRQGGYGFVLCLGPK